MPEKGNGRKRRPLECRDSKAAFFPRSETGDRGTSRGGWLVIMMARRRFMLFLLLCFVCPSGCDMGAVVGVQGLPSVLLVSVRPPVVSDGAHVREGADVTRSSASTDAAVSN